MKKFLPKILIALIIVNLFAPFSIAVNTKQVPTVNKLIAEAAGGSFKVIQKVAAENYWEFVITVEREKTDTHFAVWVIRDKPGGDAGDGKIIGSKVVFNPASGQQIPMGLKDWVKSEHTFTASGLEPNTTYYFSAGLQSGDSQDGWAEVRDKPFSTTAVGVIDKTVKEIGGATAEDGFMPSCGIGDSWITGGGTILGCFAQLVYYVLFVPTSFLFGLAGSFFDNTFAYSINNASYDVAFVVEGWGVVRDFVNMFFIFVLLWIAFSTILSVHGFKTKEMIINVVIIGLLINFSLFATQIIVDTSNVLARVFYNSESIKLKKHDGTPAKDLEAGKPIPLSAAIVAKVEPQRLILEGSRNIGVIDPKTNTQATGGDVKTDLGVGTFILITLLATAVNVVGLIVFLTVGLIFVARVIGLWIAMILVPLAFFSYTVPSMKGIDMIGWEHWWPETLKLAFLAPIFMFFMYLILKFLSLDLIDGKAGGLGGVGFVISIIVPFAFIMILLWKAKSIAMKFSGDIGAAVTKTGMAVGGLALGGAALGTAMLGRNIIGRGMAAASKTDGAQKMMKYRQDLKDYNSGKTAVAPVKPKIGLVASIGDRLNKKQEKIGEVDHARQEIDAIKEKAHIDKNISDGNLSAVDEKKIKDTYAKEKRSDAETIIRKDGYKDPHTNATIVESEDTYKAAKRGPLVSTMKKDPSNMAKDSSGKPTGELTDEAKKKVENQLSADFNIKLKAAAEVKLKEDYEHLRTESKVKVGGVERTIAGGNKASYDVRNLSQTKTDRREGWGTKMAAGLISGVAMGVRMGLKKGANVDPGTGQKDFFKDLGNTLELALKGIKIDVKSGGGGHAPAKDDHGGGGGHH